MGQFWDKLKALLGIGVSNAPGGSGTPRIEDRILNADKHKFKTETNEAA